jgi:hypothetical protein
VQPKKPCRDCGAQNLPTARACESCGILNPVLQWVAYPDGSHWDTRMPMAPVTARSAAPAPVPAAPERPGRVRFAAIGAASKPSGGLFGWRPWR